MKTITVKIGVLQLKLIPSEAKRLSKYCIDKIEGSIHNEVVSLFKETKTILEGQKNINDVRWIGDLLEDEFKFSNDGKLEDVFYVPQSAGFLYFKGSISREDRKYYKNTQLNLIEEFHVLYNGYFYIAFSEINDVNDSAWFGQEVRDFLIKALVGKRWETEVIPPCPLHPDIFIVFTEDYGSGVTSPKILDNEIYFYYPIDAHPDDLVEILITILIENSFDLEYFLSMSSLEQRLVQIRSDVEERFDLLINEFKQANLIERNIFSRKSKEIYMIRQRIFEIQLLLNDFTNDSLKLETKLEKFNRNFKDNSPFYPYCKNRIAPVCIPIVYGKINLTKYIQ